MRVGRPIKKNALTEIVTSKISSQDKLMYIKIAKKEGVTVAELIRTALRHSFQRKQEEV